MEERIINPTQGIYPATPDYVHAVDVSDVKRRLYVSGTMGLERDGNPPASLEAQLDLVWSNIRSILNAADMTVDNIVRVTSYLGRAEYAQQNQDARLSALGARRVPTTAVIVTLLDPKWLVEIEVVAAN